ncbi:Coenzyme F420 hydrogenase/dehydrogenase, beta subunit C-terminal domain [bacterium]|nr:Coenzyme F420 hydrogenase/dehydrogenase, beta subunit C-terminal domain [bacterium]
MSKILKTNKGAEKCLQDFLKHLLESGKAKAVMALSKTVATDQDYTLNYSLISSTEELDNALPFFPLMPANAGKLVSYLTLKGPISAPIAVVLKPCELRAFVELVKREQGHLDNLLIISHSCGGVLTFDSYLNGNLDQDIKAYWGAVRKNQIPDKVRPTCKACIHFEPYTADISFDLIGQDLDQTCQITVMTDKGESILDGFDVKWTETKADPKTAQDLKALRQKAKDGLFESINADIYGIDNLIDVFGRCIGCHGCSNTCPICYCILCDFESKDHEFEPNIFEAEIIKRGGLRVPPNTLLFHIGRLSHMGISCVSCGLCSDVCPVEIPVSTIFSKVGEAIQDLFKYIPGKDLEEKIPLTKFEKQEFEEIEDK